jgi:glutathione S-transferase
MYSLYNIRGWGSLAPHLVLEELDVPYQNIWTTPEKVRDPAFRELSPSGLIPVLRLDDGRSVMESAAIVTFLCRRPSQRQARAAARHRRSCHLSQLAVLHEFQSVWDAQPHLSPEAFVEGEAAQAALKARAVERSNELFEVIETKLRQEGHGFWARPFQPLTSIFSCWRYGPSRAKRRCMIAARGSGRCATACASARGSRRRSRPTG